MAEENEVVVDKTLETGTDTNTDTNVSGVLDLVHPNDALDKRLDELAGRKPNEAATTVDKTKVQQGTTTDATGKTVQATKPPVTQEQRPASEGRRQTYSPRAYPKSYKVDSANNVIDATTGAIIATAGGQRYHFERTILPYIENIRGEAEKYKLALDAANTANTTAASLGLAPDEYLIGAKIMKAWKTNPKEAIKYLLTEAQNSDIDVSDIVAGGGGASPTMIRTALKEEVAEALKPFLRFVERDDNELQQRESHQRAEEGVNQLLAEYPDAELHGYNVALIMQHHAQNDNPITMREAYLILKNHALTSGLDFTKDLTPQVQAKATNGRVTTTPNVDTTRRIPNMTGGQGNGSIIPKPPNKADGLADTGDIVKQAMREAGIQIQ